jgi:opacity protein-like surface antigen
MRRIALLLASVATFAATPVLAQDEPLQARFYGSVFVGAAFGGEYEMYWGPDYKEVYDLDTSIVVGGTLGGWVNDWLRAEAELSHQRFDIDSVRGIGGKSWGPEPFSGEGHIGATYLLANGWVGLPGGDLPVSPYVGGGIGAAWLNPDWRWPDQYGHVDGGVSFAYQLGGGIMHTFANGLTVDLGYRYKVITDTDVTDTNDDVGEGSLSSHNIQLGLIFAFGQPPPPPPPP